ncbi:HNH endonuclease [Acinetobacter baumannii]|uniref:HNH endonuclease n=1 Tax=Acinetobacter baumannii TaxID=470 RepID=UPI0025A1DFF1|nr:HNH endonuclease [Acinetobacter baumannii]
MSRPCREFGCTNLVRFASQKGYCDDHANRRSGWGKRHDRTGSTTERGYGYAWRKLRESILERDRYVCVQCRAVGRVSPATDVDHIKAKAFGGTDDPENLQSLCGPCHKNKTQQESRL